MKVKVFAPINLALIKYWGKDNELLRIPSNSSFSITLTKIGSETEVEFVSGLKMDEVFINGKEANKKEGKRVTDHLERVRKLKGFDLKARVKSTNNFPKSAGLSSSASSMAALSLAASKAANLNLNEKDLSRLARIASGSACRSIPEGFVEWIKGRGDEDSYAKTIFPRNHWDLRVLVVILSEKKKEVGSSKGMKEARTSEIFEERLKRVNEKMSEIKKIVERKDFSRLGEITEEDCLNMHEVMRTQKPSLVYWLPETVKIMRKVIDWRKEGLEGYFSINTGQNIFVICEPENEDELVKRLEKFEEVIEVKRDRIGKGARII